MNLKFCKGSVEALVLAGHCEEIACINVLP